MVGEEDGWLRGWLVERMSNWLVEKMVGGFYGWGRGW
jgi:hypothetical protein